MLWPPDRQHLAPAAFIRSLLSLLILSQMTPALYPQTRKAKKKKRRIPSKLQKRRPLLEPILTFVQSGIGSAFSNPLAKHTNGDSFAIL
ncbi:hypothetical protein BJY52DRAFT_444407 [Lactarius psammicola]|nr:hypothetical protein BJY52DRAFT_444407 [Lactarius psammicola]